MTELSPAILTDNIEDFRIKYAELLLLSHHFKTLHVDFIDDEFIHNKTVMPADLHFFRTNNLTMVAHFMTLDPKKYFPDAKHVGFDWVLFHYEAFTHDDQVTETIQVAKKLGLKPGLVINPETPLRMIAKFLKQVEMVQLMGIHPGFQGRPFMVSTIDKVHELRALSKSVIIAVDGGVKVGIARQLAKAGADILVAGSAILKSEDEAMAIEALKADIES